MDVTVCFPTHADGALHLYSAGVSGLTTTLLLAKNKEYAVTVAAKYMPGDYDIEYASPWAGANYLPFVSRFFGKKKNCSLVRVEQISYCLY